MPRKRKGRRPTARQAATKYARDVVAGRVVAGQHVRQACERFLDDLRRSDVAMDWKRVAAVVRFCESMRHSTGAFAGQQFRLEPWQLFVFANVFGFQRNGLRRFRELFCSVGRGNGKSPMLALIALVLLCFDEPVEYRADIRCAATERSQAFIVWDEIRRFVLDQPALKRRFEIYGGRETSFTNELRYGPTDGAIRPIGKGQPKSGWNLHLAIFDELHEFRPEHEPIYETLLTALGKRRQPLAAYITTAGDEKSTLWKRLRDYAAQVASGVLKDDTLFVYLAEIDPEDNTPIEEGPKRGMIPAIELTKAGTPTARARNIAKKANPNYGVSVQPDYLDALIRRANSDPEALRILRRYHLNVQVRSTQKVISPERWGESPELPDLSGRTCHGGLDLGWRSDLASLYLAFRLDDGTTALRGWSWIPERGDRDLARQPWASWLDAVHVIATPGNTTDFQAIYNHLEALQDEYHIASVAYDPNNATEPGQRIQDDLGIEVFPFYQTCRKYNEPTNRFLDDLDAGQILHGNDPVLAWAATNCVLKTDSNELVMPDKKSAEEKIDPFVATLMAYSECLFANDQGGGGEVILL